MPPSVCKALHATRRRVFWRGQVPKCHLAPTLKPKTRTDINRLVWTDMCCRSILTYTSHLYRTTEEKPKTVKNQKLTLYLEYENTMHGCSPPGTEQRWHSPAQPEWNVWVAFASCDTVSCAVMLFGLRMEEYQSSQPLSQSQLSAPVPPPPLPKVPPAQTRDV